MQQDMTRGPIVPHIIKFTIPLFTGNLFQQFYNMADTVIVGRFVGADALAAVGSTGTIMFLLMGFAMGITSGFSILTSQKFGAGDEEGVKQSIATGTIMTIIIAAALSISSSLGVNSLLTMMNTPENIIGDARSYLTIICAGLSACIMYNLLSAYLRAVGNSQAPLFFLVFSAILNIGLDILLIVHFKMGTAGAALATVLSQGISAVLCLFYIIARVKLLVPRADQWRIDSKTAGNQLRMGLPMALQFGVTASGTMIMQTAINIFGSTAIAAFTAASKVSMLLTEGMFSLGQTMATYCGQNYGKGDISRLKEGTKRAIQIGAVYSIISGILLMTLLPFFLSVFFSGDTSIAELLPWARTYAILSAVFYIPLCMIFIYRSAMEGCGYALLVLICGIVEFITRFGCAILSMNVHSYFLAVFCDPAAWLTAGVFSFFAFLYVMKDVEKKLSPSSELKQQSYR